MKSIVIKILRKKILNKVLIVVVALILNTDKSFGQNNVNVELQTIIQYAKLLTVKPLGYYDADSTVKILMQQEVKVDTVLSKYVRQKSILIQIKMDQSFIRLTSKGEKIIGYLEPCDYVILYNLSRQKYYRIQGFNHTELRLFFAESEAIDVFSKRFIINKMAEVLNVYTKKELKSIYRHVIRKRRADYLSAGSCEIRKKSQIGSVN